MNTERIEFESQSLQVIDFQHLEILTVEKLNFIRDLSLTPFLQHADGILHGFHLSMDEHSKEICVSPGAIKYHHRIHLLSKSVRFPVEATITKGRIVAVLSNEKVERFQLQLVVGMPSKEVMSATQITFELGRFVRDFDEQIADKGIQFDFLGRHNCFDLRYKLVSGQDSRLTYSFETSSSFAQSLLAKDGCNHRDAAFAWQALSTSPSRTMWECYLSTYRSFLGDVSTWFEDGEMFHEQLRLILNHPSKQSVWPIPTVMRSDEKSVQISSNNEDVKIEVD